MAWCVLRRLAAGWTAVPLLLLAARTLVAADHGDYLLTIPVGGGEPTRLVSEAGRCCGSPRWSPDGKWVAYDTVPAEKPVRHRDGRVVIVRADGTGRREIADGGMPTWSPDGTQLAWHTYDGSSGIQVGNRDGTGIETVIDHWGNPIWLANDLGVVSIDGGGLSLLRFATGTESMVLATPDYIQYGYSVSPQCDRVSYYTRRQSRDYYAKPNTLVIAAFDPDVEPLERVQGGAVEYSSWSPDGKRLVVAWKPVGERFQLYTLTADGDDKPVRIPGQGEAHTNIQPDWSPDGRTIVFRRYAEPE